MTEWNQGRIQQYIDNEVEESNHLDYKQAGAIDRSKKKEIAKDVSAMANAAGGVIIYGVSEHEHLPQAITPIDREMFPKEWLDQVITHNIQPSIKTIIHSVDIDTAPEHVVYVVEIPQSTTAHQVTADKDYRYYERSNFVTVRMEHYRIMEVMNRTTSPNVNVEFRLHKTDEIHYYQHTLIVMVKNIGMRTIERFRLRFKFPYIGIDDLKLISAKIRPDFRLIDVQKEEGIIDHHLVTYQSVAPLFPGEEIGIGSQEIYPRCLGYSVRTGKGYDRWLDRIRKSRQFLSWEVYADDMLPKQGKIPLSELYN